MRYYALATDYDGTLATRGEVDEETVAVLERVKDSGRRLIMVTGRELDDLRRVFPRVDLFDRVVAENGAVLYRPETREEKALAAPPEPRLVEALRARGVAPLSVGASIVATWEPHEAEVLATIRELGLELQVTFNKGAVMVLPSGVNKASGLAAALAELRLSPHNTVAVGDAENDHAFLDLAEAAVAVANALPALQERADLVTHGERSAGVRELAEQLLRDDLAGLEAGLVEHHFTLGHDDGGDPVTLAPYGSNLLLVGESGSGKSTLATALLEELRERAYQHCVIDPEGDYEELEGAITIGTVDRPPVVQEVLDVLADPRQNAVVNFLALPSEERPAFFERLLPALSGLRVQTGYPHWLLIDEAHHLLPSTWQPTQLALPQRLSGLLLVTVHPRSVSSAVLRAIDTLIAVGDSFADGVGEFAAAIDEEMPDLAGVDLAQGTEALCWRPGQAPLRFHMRKPRARSLRHRRKYAQGDLGDVSFVFTGPEGRLSLRAQNLTVFLQMGDGVDDETWKHHLHAGHYSRWMREAIKNDELADEVERVEQQDGLSANESRASVRAAVERHYSAPA